MERIVLKRSGVWLLAAALLLGLTWMPAAVAQKPALPDVSAGWFMRGKITRLDPPQGFVVNDRIFFVDENTRILGRFKQPLAYGSLKVGMLLDLYRTDGGGGRLLNRIQVLQ